MTPEQLVAVLGAITALAVAIGAVIVQLVQLRKQVNGRLSELLERTAAASQSQGELAGRDFRRRADDPHA